MIVLDNREHKLIKLFQVTGHIFEVKPLDIGDVLIIEGDHEICIERKTLSDLESSVKDGRYSEQKMRLQGTCQNCMYIIEGYNGFASMTSICKGAIINSTLRDKVSMLFSDSIDDTFHLIMEIATRVEKNPDKYFAKGNNAAEYASLSGISKKKSDNITKVALYQKQLSLIPGISVVKAKTIIDGSNTSSLYQLLDKIKHDEFKLGSIKNIGPKLEQNVINFLL
jgi:ERCC4-type nuclease